MEQFNSIWSAFLSSLRKRHILEKIILEFWSHKTRKMYYSNKMSSKPAFKLWNYAEIGMASSHHPYPTKKVFPLERWRYVEKWNWKEQNIKREKNIYIYIIQLLSVWNWFNWTKHFTFGSKGQHRIIINAWTEVNYTFTLAFGNFTLFSFFIIQ